MTIEIFKSVTFRGAFDQPADVWILIDPDNNPWTQKVDWELGLLIRRSRERRDVNPKAPLLIATPEGWPSPRFLVLYPTPEGGESWLSEVRTVMSKMRAKSAIVLPPEGAKPPPPKQLAELSKGEWGIRWVDYEKN